MAQAAMMRALAPLALAVAGLVGCATPPAPGAWHERRQQPLRPAELHEACVRMQPGDRLEYAFAAQRAIDFDIHFHEGKAIVAPVTRENVTSIEGAFDALDAHEYCMTWRSGPPGTLVDYRYRLLPGGARR
jgi:hypothetical protein